MKKQYLTDDEIRRLWKHKDVTPKKMILILSQLDACEFRDMRDRCEALGLIKEGEYAAYRKNKSDEADGEYKKTYNYASTDKKPWSPDEIREAFRMKRKGYSHEAIAYVLGRSICSVNGCIRRYADESR